IARRGDAARACALVEELAERHLATFDELVPVDRAGARKEVAALFDQLRAIASALAVLHEATPRSLDAIAAIGELASSRIVTAALAARGLPVVWADPRALIVTDDNFTAAAPRLEETARSVRETLGPAVAQGRVVVTGG